MTKFLEKRLENRVVSKDEDIVVIYHGNCSDGFGAAWAAWKKFGDSAQYFAVKHNSSPPDGLVGKEVYLVDFVYSEKETEKIIKENKTVTAIDHHISVEETVKMTKNYVYDINHSGAVLSWKYFHPDKPTPKILEYVEDTDLWKFELSSSKEIFIFLDLFDFDFKLWDELAEKLENESSRKECIEKGALLLKYEFKLIERLVTNNIEAVEFEGYKTLAVNSPIWQSQIGHILSKKMPPIGIIWYQNEREVKVSLRSDGTVDVSELAKKYGGGGHKAASGFTIPFKSKLPWKRI